MPRPRPTPPDAAWFDSISVAVLVRDREGNLADHNLAAERLLGGCLDPLLGPPEGWFSRLRVLDEHGTPLDPALAPSAVAARTGVAIADQVIGLVDPDTGRPIWVRAGAVPLRDDEGRTCGAVVTFDDISWRKETGDRDRAAVDLLRLVAEADSLDEYVEGALLLARDRTRLAHLELEVALPGAGRIYRAGDAADGAPAGVPVEVRGQRVGEFRTTAEAATTRPWAVGLLEVIAPLVGQGLLRFARAEWLGVEPGADREPPPDAVAAAGLPWLLDGPATDGPGPAEEFEPPSKQVRSA